MKESEHTEFHIGLTMSGAISAGAYTAGVFDFLIQALEEWEQAKQAGAPTLAASEEKIPPYRVGIKVMSGASAGAITAAIGAVALADAKQSPIFFKDPATGKQKIKCYLPKLYETWVEKPTMVASQQGDIDFLSFEDLDPTQFTDEADFSHTSDSRASNTTIDSVGQPIVSLLNSRLLDVIARTAIDVDTIKSPRPYLAKTLHLYMTLSNLRGIPYKVPFDGGNYHMISHADRVHYAIAGLGTWDTQSAFADNDQYRLINVDSLINHHHLKYRWKDYAICALASAAFPIGLAPRDIGATLGAATTTDAFNNEYSNRRFPLEQLVDKNDIAPDWLQSVLGRTPFWFTSADGGIIDNDPFEYARFSLKRNTSELDRPIESDLTKADRAVIMISPFPELKPIRSEGQPASDIVSILKALMPSLINQVRFKPSELVLAADPVHGSRFLIGPKRIVADEKEERYAIASGLLGGFGGFLAHSFRDHDFQLGRRNCQRFLQKTFALPDENPLNRNWPDQNLKEIFKIPPGPGDENTDFYPIIPLFGSARDEISLQNWPQICHSDIEKLLERIGDRFDRIAPALINSNIKGFLGFLFQLPLKPGLKNLPFLIRSRILKFVKLIILADLVRRGQIQGWDLGSLPEETGMDCDDIRAILAELINPAYDQRNIEGLVVAINNSRPVGSVAAVVDAKQIAHVLTLCENAKGKAYEVWRAPWKDKNGAELFTLASRAPNLAERLIIQSGRAIAHSPLAAIGQLFPQPTIDFPGF